jgi:RNA polymerase sigma-70 factor (ECF subfamily)
MTCPATGFWCRERLLFEEIFMEKRVAIHLDDKRLVKRLLAGEERAFSQFFDEYFSRLYRFVLTRLSGREDAANEVVQVAMSKAIQKIHSYRGESALFTWLCVIGRNESIDWLRRNTSYKRHLVLTEDRPEIQAAIDSFNAPVSDRPVEQAQRSEVARLIHVALDSIPANYGNALEWKYIEGYSVKEIAKRLQVSPEAAQSLLARAKRAFREVYSILAESVVEPITGQQTS